MKLTMKFAKQFLFILLIAICTQYKLLSQESISADLKPPGIFFGANVGLSKNQIIVQGSQHVSIIEVDNENSFTGSLELGYFFSENFGLMTGLGYAQYHSQFYIDTYQDQINSIDVENDPYELRVSGSDIDELQKLQILSIPFLADFRLPLNNNMGIFIQSGVNLFIPLNESYVSNGTFTYDGYFPAYNVLFEDLPEYGFYDEIRIQSEDVLELKQVSYGIICALGLDFLVQKRVQVNILAFYNKSLSGIVQYPNTNEFILTENAVNINSILEDSDKVTLQSFGMSIGIRYYLKDYAASDNNQTVKKNQRVYKKQRKKYLR